MSEYNWGDAEESTEVKDNFKRTEVQQIMVNFNIRMKDLTPECQEEIRGFLEEFKDPRTEFLNDDYIVSKIYSMRDQEDLPFN